jgi:hypothetical protein
MAPVNSATQRLRLHAARRDGRNADRGTSPDEALRLAKLRLTLSGSALDDVVGVGRRVLATGISHHPRVALVSAFAAGGLGGRAGSIALLGRGIRLAARLLRPARPTTSSSRRHDRS